MRKYILLLYIIFTIIFLASCTMTIRPSPNQAVEYEQGIAVLKSYKTNGAVVRLLTNEFKSENPPAFYVAVANYSDKPFLFSTDNISLTTNGRLIKVFTYEDLKRKIELDQALMGLAIGLNAMSQSMMAAQPSYSYTSGYANNSFYGNFNNWSSGNWGNFRGTSHGYYSSSTTTYDPAKTAIAQSAINANMTQQLAGVAATSNIQLNNLDVILQANTVNPGEYRGGVIKIDPSYITSGAHLILRIRTPQDNHEFYFDIPSNSNTTPVSKAPIAALTIAKENTPRQLALVVAQENIKKELKISERWEKVGTMLNGLRIFVDNNTKSVPLENIVRVWVKTIATSNNYMDLLEVDCVQLKTRKLDSQNESPAFSNQTNNWKFIIPESPTELVSDAVCLKKKEMNL